MPISKFRPLPFGVTRVAVRDGAPGVRYVTAEQALEAHPPRMTDRLRHWARTAPERTFLARRVKRSDGSSGDWRELSYAEAWASARAIAQGLIQRGLSAERPVVILSENDLDHALLALGCMVAGVPWVPTSPPYSLLSQDFARLRHVLDTVTPGLVFAADAARYGRAIEASVSPDVEVVYGVAPGPNAPAGGRASTLAGAPESRFTLFSDLLATAPTSAVEAAMQATGPDTIVKLLFTSGSTRLPKAVINTHRMWCANQQQMAQSMPVLTEAPPVLVDWLPWNHTFGGNHNFGLVLYHGGTMFIDDGKPTPALIHETLRNLRDVAPTVYFNVPTGFEAIATAMTTDLALRRIFLSRARMFFYAGAALAQPVWDSLYASEEAEIGERIVMTSGLGMTESGPFGLFVTSPNVRAGDLGVPTPGLELKLVDMQGKSEIRYRGPNITPGYWRAPEETAANFDEEGFFCSGDAVKWIDAADPHQGLAFDGRIAEDFKLATGTFVSVGPLRGKIIAAGAPHVQDVVITGLNRNEVGAMVFPNLAACRALGGLTGEPPVAKVLSSPAVRARFQALLNRIAADATGSASHIARMCLLAEPPSLDHGEITDKGSINQRAVLAQRSAVVEALHSGALPGLFRPETH